jgi:hypothetical protein
VIVRVAPRKILLGAGFRQSGGGKRDMVETSNNGLTGVTRLPTEAKWFVLAVMGWTSVEALS